MIHACKYILYFKRKTTSVHDFLHVSWVIREIRSIFLVEECTQGTNKDVFDGFSKFFFKFKRRNNFILWFEFHDILIKYTKYYEPSFCVLNIRE